MAIRKSEPSDMKFQQTDGTAGRTGLGILFWGAGGRQFMVETACLYGSTTDSFLSCCGKVESKTAVNRLQPKDGGC